MTDPGMTMPRYEVPSPYVRAGLPDRWLRIPLPDLRPLGYPCMSAWTPRTCRSTAVSTAAWWRSPIDHVCGLPMVFPHVCRCVRCGNGAKTW